MYTAFFGLAEKPFAITPDPRFLFLSERHSEALAHLLYGLEEAGGFTQLTGEVGTGKTTIIRSLLTRLPKHVEVALILNPRLTPLEFLTNVAQELGISITATERSIPVIVEALNQYLLKAHADGRRVVVLIDEAQQLPIDVLEQVRLLTNLETASAKLLQIILVGQPELRDVLARQDLRQLAQRITSRTHLDPLTADESITYIKHRLSFAGATTDIFTKDALKALVKSSKGIPRLINVIADRALLGAFAHDAHQVTADIVYQAAEEVHGIVTTAPMTKWVVAVATFVIMMALGVLTYPVIHHVVMPDKTRLKDSSTDSLGTFLSTHSSMTGTDTAFQTLFGLWNLRFVPNDQKPCQQAAQQNLQCVADRGTIAQIKRINRPVILSLIDAHSNEYQVVVTHLTNDTVTLAAGSASIAIKAEDLLPFWYGDFLLLWHPPVSDLKNISPGQKGLEILWLRQAVAAALHIPPKGTNDVYDKSLEKDIEAFQKLNHLNVDGIVGPETQMLLDAALDSPQVPHLLSEAQ